MIKVLALSLTLLLCFGFAQNNASHHIGITVPSERVLSMGGQLIHSYTEAVSIVVSGGEIQVEPSISHLELFANNNQPWYLIASFKALGNAPSSLAWQLATGETGLFIHNNDSILTSGASTFGWQHVSVSYDLMGLTLADGVYNVEVNYRLF